jgi:hypothetical protein
MFNTFCYFLNFLSPLLVSVLRRAVYFFMLPFVDEKKYTHPYTVGYESSISVPLFGTLAFRELQSGKLRFRW